jgi:hypothetical protein
MPFERLFPDYLHDWNAMHEAVNSLNYDQRMKFLGHLDDITRNGTEHDFAEWFPSRFLKATLEQYSEAFLRTIGKWEDK